MTVIYHVGLTVRDLEQAVQFYGGVLGLEEERRVELSGERIEKIVGLPGAHLKIAILRQGDMRVELIQYLSPPGRQETGYRTCDVGLSHLAFYVDDLQEAYERLRAQGVRFTSEPQIITTMVGGGERRGGAVYALDPDGITIEFVQRPQ